VVKAVSLLAVQATRGESKYSSYSFLTSTPDGVSCQRYAPIALYPRGKDPRYPLDKRLRGLQSWSGHKGYRKNSLSLPGIETRSSSLQSDTILTDRRRVIAWFLVRLLVSLTGWYRTKRSMQLRPFSDLLCSPSEFYHPPEFWLQQRHIVAKRGKGGEK
jgi:hypothetical protein